MCFIGGILISWSIIYLLLVVTSVFVYFRFGRPRVPLLFAAFCFFMGVYDASSALQIAARNLEQSVMPGRMRLASITLAGAALFFLGMSRAEVSETVRRRLLAAIGSVALVFAVLNLIGLTVDYDRPSTATLNPFFLGKGLFYQHEFSASGYASTFFSLTAAIIGGVLLGRSARNDPLARNFFYIGVVVIIIIALNDIMVANHIIGSFFVLEHGMFLLTISVLGGLLREFDLSRRELQERTRALESANLRLDRAADETRRLRPMANLGRLSASLAHEIRNPLAVLSNVASSLQHQGATQADPERHQSLVKILQEETDRLARLVDDLLLFASAGRVSREPIEAAELVRLACQDAERQLSAGCGIVIATEVSEGLPSFIGNLENLRRALLNLIINAVQSSRAGGKVRVIARLSPDSPERIMIGVSDQAGGVPEKEESEIFEPFFSTRPTGTGLGLPIAKSIVEAHGGKLVLQNRPGIGTDFWMYLPVSPSAESLESDAVR